MTEKKQNLLLVFFSIIIALFLFEIIFQFLIYKDSRKHYWDERYMLFEEGEVFQNVENFFKYHPNKKILSETFYRMDGKFIKEYSYEITTNNFGLVQNSDIKKDKESILFLGDSFIEGQGAVPWVNYFDGRHENYQIINGGIIGAGPTQFEMMEKHISKEFKIKKVVFFYIGDDIRRKVSNMPLHTLRCLKKSSKCKGDENFYGFQLRTRKPDSFLKFLSNYRDEQTKSQSFKYYRRKMKNIFSNFYIWKIPHNFFKQKFYNSENEKIIKNFKSINNLYKKYKNNIYFIQLKQKNEIKRPKNYNTIYAEKYIKSLTEKHFYCDFENNLKNFYEIDAHPNSKGYLSLYKCTKKILSEN